MIGRIRNKFGNQLKVIRYIGILAVALIALSVPVGAVFADEPPQTAPEVGTEEINIKTLRNLFDQLEASDDARTTFTGFTIAQQNAVVDAMTNAVVVYYETQTAVASDNSNEECNYLSRAAVNRVPGIGYVLWEYRSSTRWCYDGATLTRDPFWKVTHKENVIYWEFVRHVDKSESGGKGDSEYSNYAEGHFRMCLPATNVCVNKYPNVTKNLYADGTYETSVND